MPSYITCSVHVALRAHRAMAVKGRVFFYDNDFWQVRAIHESERYAVTVWTISVINTRRLSIDECSFDEWSRASAYYLPKQSY